MTYTEKLNELRDGVYNLIKDAELANTRGVKVRVSKRSIPKELGIGDCPWISVFKTIVTGDERDFQQPALILPRNLSMIIGIIDYSQVNLDDAEAKTDDLINKVLTILEGNVTIDNKTHGIKVLNVTFDWEGKGNIWFSEPFITLELKGTQLP